MKFCAFIAAVMVSVASPSAVLANSQPSFYTEEQLLSHELAGARVGVAVSDIDDALAANGYTKDDEYPSDTMSRWENEEQGRRISTMDFVDVDGIRKSYTVTYTTNVDPHVPVSAIIQNLEDRYGKPSKRLDRGMAWLVEARQNQFDSRPMLIVEQRDAKSLTFTLQYFGARDAALEVERKAEMERMKAEFEEREKAATEAAANLDLGL